MIINTHNLGKKYLIDKYREGPMRSMGEDFINRLKGKRKLVHEEFWALQNINVGISEGETVGIIGPNGSGKSTFLKLLSRVTWPSTGRLEISGRIGALLEVGTGFHGELTGRENIFLSGAILGMRRSEVKQYFDEIVAFSEIEEFLDTSVKKYSSGMFLRLAFSVMAHLNSEILIVDEIFSVGDNSFQKKCFAKMQSLSEKGRTIIIVSHQAELLQTFCTRLLWFEKGILIADGETETLLSKYQCKAALHV